MKTLCFQEQSPGQGMVSDQDVVFEMMDVKKSLCYKCREIGHNLDDCPNSVFYVICGKDNHVTSLCTWPKQPKSVAKFVGYAAKGLGCLLI